MKKKLEFGCGGKKTNNHAIFALSPQGVNANLSFFRVYKVLTGGERGWGGVSHFRAKWRKAQSERCCEIQSTRYFLLFCEVVKVKPKLSLLVYFWI